MGACTFDWFEKTEDRSLKGRKAAFSKAVKDAQYECGHGVYTGTIAEKDEFTFVGLKPTIKEAREFAQLDTEPSETLTGVIFDAVYWSGNVPTLAQCQDISRDYYGTVYAPRRVGAFISSVGGGGGFVFNPLTGRGGAAAQPLVIH
jgi:hypothetical protein